MLSTIKINKNAETTNCFDLSEEIKEIIYCEFKNKFYNVEAADIPRCFELTNLYPN